MKKIFSLFAVAAFAVSVAAQTNLFDPAAATFHSYYIAPGWNPDGVSSATYDPTTGTINVDIKSQLLGQWQGQVKIKHNVAFSAEKQYKVSAKFHSTALLVALP